jgi:hypothetical protein
MEIKHYTNDKDTFPFRKYYDDDILHHFTWSELDEPHFRTYDRANGKSEAPTPKNSRTHIVENDIIYCVDEYPLIEENTIVNPVKCGERVEGNIFKITDYHLISRFSNKTFTALDLSKIRGSKTVLDAVMYDINNEKLRYRIYDKGIDREASLFYENQHQFPELVQHKYEDDYSHNFILVKCNERDKNDNLTHYLVLNDNLYEIIYDPQDNLIEEAFKIGDKISENYISLVKPIADEILLIENFHDKLYKFHGKYYLDIREF